MSDKILDLRPRNGGRALVTTRGGVIVAEVTSAFGVFAKAILTRDEAHNAAAALRRPAPGGDWQVELESGRPLYVAGPTNDGPALFSVHPGFAGVHLYEREIDTLRDYLEAA